MTEPLAGRRVLVINIGWEQEIYVRSLHAAGACVLAVHHNDKFDSSLPVSRVLTSDYFDVKRITAFAREQTVDAVIADQCDYALYAASFVAERLNLPGPGIEAAIVASNKFLQRQRIQSTSLVQPSFSLCLCERDVHQFAKKFGYPVIVKPVDARGSFGVTKVSKADQACDAVTEALANSPGRLALVETFIAGLQLTVDGYCFDGQPRSLAVASKIMIDDERQVAVDVHYPARIDPGLIELASRNNEAIAQALGFHFGFIHGEYILTPTGELYLVEIANRGGGCFTSTAIVPRISGVDTVMQLIADACGAPDLACSHPQTDGALLKFFTLAGTEVLASIGNIDLARRAEGVVALRVNSRVGDTIEPVHNDADRHGFTITAGAVKHLHCYHERALEILGISFTAGSGPI